MHYTDAADCSCVGAVVKAESVLTAGGGCKDNYLTEMISHVIADDGTEEEVAEAKDLFRLPVVMV